MDTQRTIYEQELPPAADPDVRELAAELIGAARAAQRPVRALLYALPSVVVGALIWGELNRWARFDMPWLLMAGSAVVLGVAMGRPYRMIGHLFDERWALLAGALGLLMALLGDLHAALRLTSQPEGLSYAEVLASADLAEWLRGRRPIDWLVAGLGAIGAYVGARPSLDARQLEMEARVAIHLEDLAGEEALEDEAPVLRAPPT